MARIVRGKRVGRQGKLGLGCSAMVLDEEGRMLLVRRADNGRWAVPGGYMQPGESVAEACAREVKEESGLDVEVQGLVAVYSSPDRLIVYEDGNQWQLVILHFYAELLGGFLTTSEETTAVRFFSQDETTILDMGEWDRLRVRDGFAFMGEPFIR